MNFLRDAYRFGLGAALRLVFHRDFKPRGIGPLLKLRRVMPRVGGRQGLLPGAVRRVNRLLDSAELVDVVLTLHWGGGSKAYLDRKLAKMGSREAAVVLEPWLCPQALLGRLYVGGALREEFMVESLSSLVSLKGKCRRLLVNHLLQWNEYASGNQISVVDFECIISQILDLRTALETKLVYLVHDYFCICPRYVLIGPEGVYCQSEVSAASCESCLANPAFRPIDLANDLRIKEWRRAFVRLIEAADQVRVFSQDAQRRILSVFPNARCQLVAHEAVTEIPRRPRVGRSPLVIGVIGTISEEKGSRQVLALARYLDDIGEKTTRIVVIGRLLADGAEIPSRITVSGEYKPEDLVDLVESLGVNLAFFSSVCPETFSYVTQELMMMDLPIACYGFGAPAERVAKYEKGIIIPRMTPESAWRAVRTLAERMGLG